VRAAGLEVADSVTKKLDILVVADPHTQSGKARKARQYGTRIVHEPVFWQMLGVTVK
jgi:DNA polymerase-3 subunit epsilon